MKPKDRLVDKIEVRLQFALVIVIFFLTVFPDSLLPGGSILVVGYIINYIFFAVRGDKIKDKYLRVINIITLVGMGSFVIPLTLLALSTQKGVLPAWEAYTWMGSSLISILLMFVAPLSLLVVLVGFGINWKKEFGY